MTKVSLIVPTYNGERYILHFLESINAQTLQPDEVIFQDDQSSDRTVKIIESFTKKFQRNWSIKVNEYNLGWRLNFESLLKQAQGDIIFLADQDDLWASDKIEQMTASFNINQNIQVLVSDYNVDISNEGSVVSFDKMLLEDTTAGTNIRQVVASPVNYFIKRPGWTFAVSREIIPDYLKIQELCPTKSHDALLWQLALVKNGLYYISLVTGTWLMHTDSAMATETNRKLTPIDKINTLSEYSKEEILSGKFYLRLMQFHDNNKLSTFIKKRIINCKFRITIWEQLTIVSLIKALPTYCNYHDIFADIRIVFKGRAYLRRIGK